MSHGDEYDKSLPYGERYNRDLLCQCGHTALWHQFWHQQVAGERECDVCKCQDLVPVTPNELRDLRALANKEPR